MANVTLAASEKTVQRMFNGTRDGFRLNENTSGSFGPFTAGIAVKAHLEGGDLDLRSDNSFAVKELDVLWDKLDLRLGIDIPQICAGGFCIIPTPFGCIRAPRVCVFSANPDIDITLPLGGLIRSEVSMTGSLKTNYFNNPARPSGMNAWQAHAATPTSLANQWQLLLTPQTVDLDVFDVPDIVGDLLQNVIDFAIDNLLGFLPGWLRSIVRGILGFGVDLVRAILDIADDIQEWLSDLLNVSLGLTDIVLQLVAQYFAERTPLTTIEDPYPMLKKDTVNMLGTDFELLPVLVPITALKVFNTDDEMVVEASVG
jgi:hypothetical protein